MPDEERFGSRVEDQRGPGDFEFTKFFEHILRALDNPCLIFCDLADDASVILLGHPEKCADRPYCFQCLGAREVRRSLDAGRALTLDQIAKELAVVLTTNLQFD